MRHVVLCCVVLIGVTAAVTRVPSPTNRTLLTLDDLNQSVEALLRELPGVVDVEVHRVTKPTQRIIHLRDWHFITKDHFSIDQREKDLSDKQLDERYHEFLRQVDSVQLEQMTLLRTLILQHGLKRLFCEGLSSQDISNYRKTIGLMRDIEANQITSFKKQLKEVRELLHEKPDPDVQLMERKILDLLEEFDWQLVEIGAAGRLLMSGEIQEVLPMEDKGLLDAATPLTSAGAIQFDVERVMARRDAIVRNVLKTGPTCWVILGGDHDLSENVSRVSGGTCEYIRVTTHRVKSALGQ